MGAFEVNTTYEPFSKEPEYIEANRAFIRSLDLEASERILDLACGTGTLADLVLEIRPDVAIVGLDISRESLLLAQAHFAASGELDRTALHQATVGASGRAKVFLIQGTADSLPLKACSVDAVLMGNSIHLIPEEDKLLAEVRRMLRPGGLFAFNTSFYAGTFAPGTERVHHEWVMEAIAYVKRKNEESRRQGLGGIPRKRGSVPRAFSKPWPSPRDWTERLVRQGFQVSNIDQRTVLMTQRCFEMIGAYAGFATVILSGYPAHVASEALQAAAAPALAAVNVKTVPRYWLEVAATRE